MIPLLYVKTHEKESTTHFEKGQRREQIIKFVKKLEEQRQIRYTMIYIHHGYGCFELVKTDKMRKKCYAGEKRLRENAPKVKEGEFLCSASGL